MGLSIMHDSYLFERQYKSKNFHLNISEDWKKILGESTLEMLCDEYTEVLSFLNESSEYCLKKELMDEYSEMLKIYNDGKYMYETIKDDDLQDKLFYAFYSPFLRLAQYYGKMKFGLFIEKFFALGIQDEIYNSLSNIATRILVNEIQFLAKELTGRDAKEKYLDYTTRYLCDSEYIKEVFLFYPLLLRCMLDKIYNILFFFNELFYRWKKDLPVICKCMQLKNTEIVYMKKVGDSHRNGRFVVGISFKDGRNIFYKPRNLEVSKIYYEFLDKLYLACGLTTFNYPIISLKEYGWESEVEYIPCENRNELHSYYKRVGIHLMLSYVLDIQDLHYENLIAHGEFPVFVDIEVICGNIIKYQKISTAEEKAEWMLESSVLGSSILPRHCRNRDLFCALSGKGGVKTGWKSIKIVNAMTSEIRFEYVDAITPNGKNIPSFEGRLYDYEEFVQDISLGFKQAYQYINSSKGLFSVRFRDFTSRLLINHTHNYSRLIQLSYHPKFMCDGAARQMVLSKNFSLHMKKDMNNGKYIFESELHSLVKGDIPYFTFSSGKTDLYLENDNSISGYLEIIPEKYIDMRIDSLSNKDYKFQKKLLTNVLGNIEKCDTNKINKKSKNNPALALCKQIGDYLIEIMINNYSNTDITWIIPSSCAIHVSDMYLYEGISGITLFFAALNTFVPTEQYGLIEQKLVNKLVNYTISEKNIGIYSGAFCGDAAIIYTYLLLYKITDNEQFIKYAKIHETKLFHIIRSDKKYDLLYGNAGAILVYINLFEVTSNKVYLERARIAADYLIRKAKRTENGVYWSDNEKKQSVEGLAHGGSGFSLCFTRLYEKTFDKKYLDIALDAIKYENKIHNDNNKKWGEVEHECFGKEREYWCHGAGGIALSRKIMLKYLSDVQYDCMLKEYLRAVKKLKRTLEFNMKSICLCHGLVGNMMIIKGISEEDPEMLRTQCFSKVKEYISNATWETLENGNPGFMMGLCGIGYGLLYMWQDDQRIPNILKLEI